MLPIFRNALSIIAATSLLIAQPAMATRSVDSLPTVGAKVASVQGQRAGSRLRKSDEVTGGSNLPIVILSLVAVITGVIVLGKGKNDSPG